ncbi:MAG: rhodanese-like domain-containing protein [Muribaculaceae bacterium]|nr:rhodanese-like domain-containing protein [Muribaculaceae bacterium]
METTDIKTKASYKILEPDKFRDEIKSPDVYLLDVRTTEEFNAGHIENAHNLDVTQPSFVESAKEILPKDKIIAVYCKSGKRAGQAADILSGIGYDVIDLQGGIEGWIAAGLPTV